MNILGISHHKGSIRIEGSLNLKTTQTFKLHSLVDFISKMFHNVKKGSCTFPPPSGKFGQGHNCSLKTKKTEKVRWSLLLHMMLLSDGQKGTMDLPLSINISPSFLHSIQWSIQKNLQQIDNVRWSNNSSMECTTPFYISFKDPFDQMRIKNCLRTIKN